MLPELYFLDIKQMVSTWLDLIELMSMGHFDNHLHESFIMGYSFTLIRWRTSFYNLSNK